MNFDEYVFLLIEEGKATKDHQRLHIIVRELIRVRVGHCAWPDIKILMRKLRQMSQKQAA